MMVLDVLVKLVVPLLVVFIAMMAYFSLNSDDVVTDKEKSTTLFMFVSKGLKRLFGHTTGNQKLVAFGIGALVGVINYFAPKLYGWGISWLAIVFFILMIGLYVYILALSVDKEKGISSVKEIIPLIVVEIIIMLTLSSVVWAISPLWKNPFATKAVTSLPTILFVVSLVWFVIGYCFYLRDDYYNEDEKSQRKACNIVATIAAIIGALIVILIIVGWPWSSLVESARAAEATVVANDEELSREVTPGVTTATESAAVSDKATAAIDLDKMYAEAQKKMTVKKLTVEELEKLTLEKYANVSQVLLDSSLTPKDKSRTEQTGFSDALTFGFKAENDTGKFAELQEEILRNPIYGVTVANAIRDKKLGDKRIGDLNPWLDDFVKLNKNGVSYWCEYRDEDTETIYVSDEYRQYAATLCTWLERLIDQGIQARQTVENWRLNDATKNNDRKGIPAEYQYRKDALILSYVTKAEGADVDSKVAIGLFTIGFNIHDKRPEFYGDEPEVIPTPTPDNPTPTPVPVTPTPDNPTPTPTPTPPTPTPTPPTPTPEPTPQYDKDPEKAPKKNTEPNDDPGPGPNTNNGEGSQYSTEDKPTNSDHYDSYQEYRDDMDELEKVNEEQRTGGDANTPSTPKPATDTKVDNNADQGTGNGGIDTPTKVSEPATNADTGQAIDTSPAGEWDGPPD